MKIVTIKVEDAEVPKVMKAFADGGLALEELRIDTVKPPRVRARKGVAADGEQAGKPGGSPSPKA